MMTFKGKTYETIIDIEKLLMVERFRIDCYASELKHAQIIRNKPRIDQIRIEMNVQLKYVEELEAISKELTENILKLAYQMNKTDDLIFIKKFIEGKDDTVIIEELHLTTEKYQEAINRIAVELENSEYGEKLKRFLQSQM